MSLLFDPIPRFLPKKPKVLFMGTPDFAVPTLQALLDWGAEVVAVVSQPDKPKGRGNQLQRTPVADFADRHQLKVYQWLKLSQESYDALSALDYDLAVVIAYGKILPKRYLVLPKFGCINLHASILPKYRGSAPIQRAIAQGETQSGVCVMHLDEGMDTGDVGLVKTCEIHADDTGQILHDRLSSLSAEALKEALDLWVEGKLEFEPQAHDQATLAPKLEKEEGKIDWRLDAHQIRNLIRAFYPWPGTFSEYVEGEQEVIKLHQAYVIDENDDRCNSWSKEIGMIVAHLTDGPVIACGKHYLCLTELQRAGKKSVKGGEFLRGYGFHVGGFLR
jgi:methionyl-tRNA formyltransferase